MSLSLSLSVEKEMATFPQDRYINRIRDPTFRVGAEATSVYIYIRGISFQLTGVLVRRLL